MDCFYSGMKKSLTALAFGTLGLGIAEFVMMGILPDVAKNLHISIPQAGHFISAYALGVCVGAPGMVLVARTRPLKHILLGLMVIYICGNFVCCRFSELLDDVDDAFYFRIASWRLLWGWFHCGGKSG